VVSGNEAEGGAGGSGSTGGYGAYAYGGGVVDYGGNLTLTNADIANNQTIAGAGGAGNSSGASGGIGGSALGGGVYSVGALVYDPSTGNFIVTPATVSATNVTLAANLAQGGAGGSGDGSGSGAAAGWGMGGAVYNDAGSALDISGGLLTLNAAEGGSGGDGGSTGTGGAGGNGLGGAIYNAGPDVGEGLPGATLSLSDSIVSLNVAVGGSGGNNASSGQGIGGGLYLSSGGTATWTQTLVILNYASTSDNNIYDG
jgi:hypothetical protein